MIQSKEYPGNIEEIKKKMENAMAIITYVKLPHRGLVQRLPHRL
jgi:hypothetical protein